MVRIRRNRRTRLKRLKSVLRAGKSKGPANRRVIIGASASSDKVAVSIDEVPVDDASAGAGVGPSSARELTDNFSPQNAQAINQSPEDRASIHDGVSEGGAQTRSADETEKIAAGGIATLSVDDAIALPLPLHAASQTTTDNLLSPASSSSEPLQVDVSSATVVTANPAVMAIASPKAPEKLPAESQPTNPEPTNPEPTNPEPTNPEPTTPEPPEPKTVEPKAVEPKAVEPKAVETPQIIETLDSVLDPVVESNRRRRGTYRRLRRGRGKRAVRRFCTKYFNSFWLPGALCLLLMVGAISALAFSVDTALLGAYATLLFWLGVLGLVLAAIAFCGVISATIWNFANKRWFKGGLNFILLLALCGGMTMATGSLLVFAMANDYTVPTYRAPVIAGDVTQPIYRDSSVAVSATNDEYQQTVLSALDNPAVGSLSAEGNTVTANIESLQSLQASDPEYLKRYLAMSSAWRLFEERGHQFATRRWQIGENWQYNLHGYYNRSDLNRPAASSYFQSRFTMGLSGEPWSNAMDDATQVSPGETSAVKVSEGNLSSQKSNVVIADDSLVVEIFEESESVARPITQAALTYTEEEFGSLARYGDLAQIFAQIPADSIQEGRPSMTLYHSFQPGLYDVNIWANPGEPGMVYLKAFDLVKDKPLSSERLKRKTSEWIGWSDNAKELYLSNTHFSVYEGNWNQPYPARFEVWFVPDSGDAERKLMEKVFEVEGWQR